MLGKVLNLSILFIKINKIFFSTFYTFSYLKCPLSTGEGIFKKYETVPSWNDLIKPSLPVNRSNLRKLLFGQTNPDNLNAGGKKGSTRTTRKTRKRNVRGRRRTNNRRHLHRRNAKK